MNSTLLRTLYEVRIWLIEQSYNVFLLLIIIVKLEKELNNSLSRNLNYLYDILAYASEYTRPR